MGHKQRGNGEGTVIKVGYRNYKAVAVVGWKDEKHPIKRTKQGFRTAKEARDYIPLLKGGRAKKRTFADYWDTIWEEVQQKEASTHRKYLKARERIEPIFHMDLHDVRVSDLNALCSDLTYNSAHALQNLVSKTYQLAMAEQYANANLAPLMTLPQNSAKKPRKPFAKGEIETMWSAWNAEHERVLGTILLMCYTGMMPIELLRMRVGNCDLTNGVIQGIGAKTEKRKESYILVPDIVLPVLEWLCTNAEQGKIITTTDKQYRITFKQKMEDLCLSAEHTPYDCRHTAATMYAQVLDPNTLKEVMRHSTLQMTEHYKHNQAQDMRSQLNLGIKKERW